jgi:hypothetical protein
MADDEQHLDLFTLPTRMRLRARCRPVTSRDHERLHAHREILRQACWGSTSA